MPPKARITRDMLIQAAFDIARRDGAERISARSVANELHCSTQPVMYHFDRVEDLKQAVYEAAGEYHTACLLNIPDDCQHPLTIMRAVGKNYVRFAAQEKNLFRFLHQSNAFSSRSMSDMPNDENILPILSVFQAGAHMDLEQVKDIFMPLFMMVHGWASLLANNQMEYSEQDIADTLERIFLALCPEMQEEAESL